jgi:hypothetical protein
MAMYSFVPPFRKAKFCGVPSCVFEKLGCAAGEESFRNTVLDQRLVMDLVLRRLSMPYPGSSPGCPFAPIQINVKPTTTPRYILYTHKKNIGYMISNFRKFKGEKVGKAWKEVT